MVEALGRSWMIWGSSVTIHGNLDILWVVWIHVMLKREAPLERSSQKKQISEQHPRIHIWTHLETKQRWRDHPKENTCIFWTSSNHCCSPNHQYFAASFHLFLTLTHPKIRNQSWCACQPLGRVKTPVIGWAISLVSLPKSANSSFGQIPKLVVISYPHDWVGYIPDFQLKYHETPMFDDLPIKLPLSRTLQWNPRFHWVKFSGELHHFPHVRWISKDFCRSSIVFLHDLPSGKLT